MPSSLARPRRLIRDVVRHAIEPLEGRLLLSAVSWTGLGDGVNWTDANNWSGKALPAAADDVTIGAGFANVQLTSGTQTINSLTSASPFSLAGGTLAVATTFQTSANVTVSSGILNRGTVAATGTAQVNATGGTLIAVTLAANMTVVGTVDISAGLTLSGGATVTLGPTSGTTGGELYFNGASQTLGGTGSVVFTGVGNDSLENATWMNGTLPGLTIGPNITVHGKAGYLTNDTQAAVLNQGTIDADVKGQQITIYGNSWWTNAGTVSASAGILSLPGTYTTGSLGTVRNKGGSVQLAGSVDNTNSTLALNATTGSWNFSGTITGGTISEGGGAKLISQNGRFTGVTVAGALNVDEDSSLYINNGLTLSGGATVTIGSATDNTYGCVYFDGASQTLGGTGSILFAGNANNNSILNQGGNGVSPATLTIGPNITVHGKYGSVGSSYLIDSLNLQGAINADVVGGDIAIGNGSWTNTGTMTATAGILQLGGTFTTASLGAISSAGGAIRISGTLDNTGNTLTLDATSGSWSLGPDGDIMGGVVTATGGAQLIAANGMLSDVTLATPLTVAEGHALFVDNGLTLSGGTTITIGSAADNSFGGLYFTGSSDQTLGGTGGIVFAGTGPNSVDNETTASNPSTLTIGPGVTIHGRMGTFSNTYPYDALVNQGTISADVAGGTIHLPAGGTWSNTGTMTATAGTLALDGTFTPAALGSVNNAGGTVRLSGTLNNAGSTLSINGTTGSWTLSGTISGGTVTQAGGARLIPASGRFSGVTLASALAVDEGHTLYVSNGLTLSGGATITLGKPSDNTYGALSFDGPSQTLDGTGSIVYSSSSLSSSDGIGNQTVGNAGAAGTLTIAPGITIHGGSGGFTNHPGDMLVNQGTISADGGALFLSGGTYTNASGGTFSTAGGAFTLFAPWSNAGTLLVNGGTMNLGGSFTTAGIGTFERSGGTVNITGTLDNTGSTLAINATTGTWNLGGGAGSGRIRGGTVTETDGAQLHPMGGGLDGVTLASPLTVDNNQFLYVSNGLTFSAGVAITLGSDASNTGGVLSFSGGSETLGGTGSIVFASTNTDYIYDQTTGGDNSSTPTTITIGPNITIHGRNGSIHWSYPDTLLNEGTISADVSGGVVDMTNGFCTNAAGGIWSAVNGGTLSLDGTWNNAGTLVEADATLNLGGAFTTSAIGTLNRTAGTVNLSGYLDNTGSTLTLSAATGTWNLKPGTIHGGTLADGTVAGDGQTFLATSSTGGTLDRVTLDGDLDLSQVNGAQVTVLYGMTLNGTIYVGNAAGSTYGTVQFGPPNSTAVTLAGTGSVVFGGSTQNTLSNTTNWSSMATIGPGITISGKNGNLQNLTNAGGFLIQGLLSADVAGGTINVSPTGDFSNQGTVSAANGGTLNLTGAVTNLSAGTLTGGTWATSSNSTLDLPAAVTANAANIVLSGPNAQVLVSGSSTSALGTLYSNVPTGSLSLMQGAGLSITPAGGTFTNDGTLELDASSTLTVSGNFNQASDGTLAVSLAGDSSFGQIDSSGTAALSGAVQVTLANGYDPAGGTSLPIVSGSAVTNNAPTFTGGPTPSGRALALQFTSNSADVYVQPGQATPPTLVGAPVINGDNPNGLFNAAGQTTPGQQRSMVEDLVYTFNESVTISNANQAFTLAVAGPAGGTLPTTLYAQAVAGSNGTQWAVSLTGMPEGTIGSIANGEYSITINPTYVFAAADGVTSMAAGTGRTDNFYRLYGDVFGTRNVTALDYSRFKSSLTTYNPIFDNYNTGNITALDYALFKKDLSIDYSGDGFVTTI